MAANVGKIFVELTLDDKPYKQKLSENLTSTEATAKGIETSWKVLGTKNDATYDAMRRSYENSLTLIKNATSSTAQDILRAEKAKNDKIQALNDQQFGAQKSGLETLKGHYLAFTVAAAAAIGAISKAWSMAKEGADFDEQSGILDNLATKYGTTSDAIVDAMDRASGYQVAKSELMKVALEGIAKGLAPKQLLDLADAAQILGDVTGKGTTASLQELAKALESGKTKALDQQGVTIDLATAFGGLEEKMTRAEKTQAMFGLVQIEVIKLQDQQKKAVDGGSDSIAQIEKKFDDATLAASRFAKTVVVSLIEGFKATFLSGNDAGETLTNFGTATDRAAEATKKQADEIKKIIDPYQAQIDKLKETLKTRNADEQAVKDHAKAVEDAAKQGIKNAEGLASSWGIYYENKEKQAKADAEAVKKYEDEKRIEAEKTAEAHKLAAQGEYDYLYILYDQDQTAAIEAGQEKIAEVKRNAEEEKQLAEQLPQMYRDVYSDIRGEEKGYYDASMELIKKQADAYEKAGMDQAVIAKWKANEEQKAYIKMGKASDDWTDGVKAGLLEIERAQVTWGGAAYDAVKTFADSSKTAISDGLFQAIKDGTVDTGAIWDTFTGNMLRSFTDSLGEMVTAAATKSIEMLFKATVSGDWTQILALINKGWDIVSGLTSGSGSGTNGGQTLDPAPAGVSYAASGGAIGGGPVWVGEKGPELLFPTAPGYVMEHGQSVAYAARNGGYIPGRAEGGPVDPPPYFQNNAGGIGWVIPKYEWLDVGTPEAPQFDWVLKNNPGPGYISLSGDSQMPGIFKIFDAGLSIASPAWALVSGLAKAATGAGDLLLGSGDQNAAWWKIAGGALQAYGGYSNIGSGAGGAAAGYSASSAAINAATKMAATYGVNYLLNMILGKTGEASVSFEGMNDNGLMAILGASMADIAPKSSSFGFSARNGLDYVPYNGFRAVLHEGERVQTSDERSNLSAEIKALREDLNKIGFYLIRNTDDSAKILKEIITTGARPVQVSVT